MPTGLTENLHLLTPEFALAGLAFLVLTIDLWLPRERKQLLPWISILGLAGLIPLSLGMLWDQEETLYGGLLSIDRYSLFFKVFFLSLGILIILSSIGFVKQYLQHPGEFYGLLLFSVLGMNVMAESRELLTAYISLELLSFSLYVMVAYARESPRSNEAALKYIIVGAFSTAILLYGISMVYSTLGATKFVDISQALASIGEVSPSLWVGLALILVGIGFKVAAVPFHMWAPDVYEGAPFPVTAYLAIGSKIAAFALMLRLFAEAFLPVSDQWRIIVAVMAAVTMVVGNLVALAQTNVKRLMAYSSIGHVGFILGGIAALSADSLLAANGVMFYLVAYGVTSLVVFAGLISFFNATGKEKIADFAGLADGQPFLAAAIAIGFFSLAGLPIFAGFTAKFYLFTAISDQGMLWLASVAIASSFISLYYYLAVIRQMYIEPVPLAPAVATGQESHSERPGAALAAPLSEHGHEASEDIPTQINGARDLVDLSPSKLMLIVLSLGLVGIVFLGVYPAPLLDVIEAASRAIIPGA